jgi:hypothetical protein
MPARQAALKAGACQKTETRAFCIRKAHALDDGVSPDSPPHAVEELERFDELLGVDAAGVSNSTA